MATALITGVTGQDGSYLAELLLKKGFKVHGTTRGSLAKGRHRLSRLSIDKDVQLVQLETLDSDEARRLVDKISPDHIYNLAAPSSVAESFRQPAETIASITQGALNLLEAIRISSPQIRFYQASSSEMFGNRSGGPHDEQSQFCPGSPYASAKVCAHALTNTYRES